MIAVRFVKVWFVAVMLLKVTFAPPSDGGPGKLEVTSDFQSIGTAVKVAVEEADGVPPRGWIPVDA